MGTWPAALRAFTRRPSGRWRERNSRRVLPCDAMRCAKIPPSPGSAGFGTAFAAFGTRTRLTTTGPPPRFRREPPTPAGPRPWALGGVARPSGTCSHRASPAVRVAPSAANPVSTSPLRNGLGLSLRTCFHRPLCPPCPPAPPHLQARCSPDGGRHGTHARRPPMQRPRHLFRGSACIGHEQQACARCPLPGFFSHFLRLDWSKPFRSSALALKPPLSAAT